MSKFSGHWKSRVDMRTVLVILHYHVLCLSILPHYLFPSHSPAITLFLSPLTETPTLSSFFHGFVSLSLLLSGLIVYLGMMVGAFVWGGLADRIGRRQTLLISLSINSVFAFFSSFVQGYVSFLFCRLASGVG